MATPSVAVINPLETVNQIVNPSIEGADIGVPRGWNNGLFTGSAVLTRDWGPLIQPRAGGWHLRVACDGTINAQGCGALMTGLGFTSGQAYTSSFWIHNQGVALNPYLGNAANGHLWVGPQIPALNAWQKVIFTATPNENVPGAVPGAMLIVRTTGLVAVTFFLDAVQVELGSVATTYIDGDQPGCIWLGAPSFSMSRRSAQSAEGGSVVKIMPSATYIDSMRSLQGIGMAPVKNVALERGLVGGATFQRSIKGVRQMNLVGEMVAPSSNYNLDALLTKRDALIGLLKPDLFAQPQQTVLRMDSGGSVLNIRGRYHSGLEFAGLKGFTMPIPLVIQNYEPHWFEDFDSSVRLAYSLSLASASRILQKPASGPWAPMGSGALDGIVYCMAQDANQNIYVGGTFTQMGGIAGTSRIAMWNPNTGVWTALTTGCSADVDAIAVGPDGMVYVGGHFVTSGGVTTNGIAKWNPATSTWSALGTGLAGIGGAFVGVYAFGFDKSSNLYAAGNFATMNGVAATVNIAKWNGAVWTPLGTGLNGGAYALAVQSDGVNIYVGGIFGVAGGVSNTVGIALWNGTAWKSLSPGTAVQVFALALALNGDLYVGGNFAGQNGVAGTAQIAKWNGSGWLALGGGITTGTGPNALAILPNGLLYVGGNFTAVNGALLATPGNMAIWNGSAWATVDVSIGLVGGTPGIWSLLYNPISQTLYVGWDTNSGTPPSVATTVVTNPGGGVASTVGSVATAFPKIYFVGPGTLYELTNMTTGDTIYFNAYPLQSNEIAVLDLTPGKISFVSNLRGNIFGQILPGSNIATWRLLPGNNTIGVYIGPVVTPGVTDSWMVWRNQYWDVSGLL